MRKTIDVTITDEGRDKGKVFVITEMSAMKAEKWATKTLLALGRSGIDMPEDVFQRGTGALVVVGISKLLHMNFADAEPLLDEMMDCIQRRPDPKKPELVMPLSIDEIEEVKTIIRLRAEVFALHTGFSLADINSKLTTMPASSHPSRNTKTSPRSSRPRSRQK